MAAAPPSYWANSVHVLDAADAWSPPFQSSFQRESSFHRDDGRLHRTANQTANQSRNRRSRRQSPPFICLPSTNWSFDEPPGDRGRCSTPQRNTVLAAASPTFPHPTDHHYDVDDQNLSFATLDYSTHVPLSRPMDYRFAPSGTAAATSYARTRSAPMAMPGYNQRPSRLHRVHPDDYNLPTTSHLPPPPPLTSSHQRFGNGYLRGNGHLGGRNSAYNNGNNVGYNDNIGNNVTKYPTPPSVNNDWSFLTTKEREHRTSTPPNVRLLREINQRAKITEKSLVYIKVLGFVHLLLGLALISMEWAKLLLVWPYLDLPERKLTLAIRALYPLYIVAVGTTTMATGIVNRKGATQLMMVSIVAMLAPFFVLPGAAPFVTSELHLISHLDTGLSPYLKAWNVEGGELSANDYVR
uniref:Uncharacterized protein n=1 Tax=Plectus sambesii TaxID=2011161 RepID=A0A914XSN9_9BILA